MCIASCEDVLLQLLLKGIVNNQRLFGRRSDMDHTSARRKFGDEVDVRPKMPNLMYDILSAMMSSFDPQCLGHNNIVVMGETLAGQTYSSLGTVRSLWQSLSPSLRELPIESEP